MTPLRLRQSGEYDADSEITVDADGRFSVEHGGYVTAGRRYGQATARQQRQLGRLAAAVDTSGRWETAGAMTTWLQIGDDETEWAGAPPTPEIAALLGALLRL